MSGRLVSVGLVYLFRAARTDASAADSAANLSVRIGAVTRIKKPAN
jgi:hypothetical protein